MPYVDETYYHNSYCGEVINVEDFPALEMRAAGIVEEITRYRLTPLTMLAMSEAVQIRVKDAVCAQIEYLDANGGADVDNGAGLQSAGLGKFNYARAAGASGSTEQSIYAPRALRYLYLTGLLYRGGGCG